MTFIAGYAPSGRGRAELATTVRILDALTRVHFPEMRAPLSISSSDTSP